MTMTTGATTIQIGQLGRVTPCAPPVCFGARPGEAHGVPRPTRLAWAFTLIELILVMALLAIVLAISAPALSRFFHSRGLDNEARRFLALTRAAQSRAVSEGVPMVVWFDIRQRTYGLNADRSFVEQDPKAEQFTVDDTLTMEARYSADALAAGKAAEFKNEKLDTGGLYTLRFNPDGFVSASSPEIVVFRQKDDGELWVAQSRNRLTYEIQPGQPVARR
jgi:type II secretion system protein H